MICLRLFYSLFVFLPLTSLFPFTLMEKIAQEGREGDCIIMQCGTTIYGALLHTSPLRMTLAKASEQVKEREGISSWVEWMKNGSTGALEVINSSINEIKDLSPELYTFLTLSWKEEPLQERKKQGPPPLPDEIDVRAPWNPKIVVQNHSRKGIVSQSFTAEWPNDGSELAKRLVVIYLPQSPDTISWFPYWIELSGGKTAIFALDSQQGPLKQ